MMRWTWTFALCGALALLCGAAPLGAQMLGVPVVQNAFANPGFTLAGDAGFASDAMAYGVAVAWAPRRLPVTVSGGLALYAPDSGRNASTWGARAMVPVPLGRRGGALGVAAFAGVGGASRSGITEVRVPIGVSVGYRRAIGPRRGVSLYASPMYLWSRAGGDVPSVSAGFFRVAAGVDLALTTRVGVTVGAEVGERAGDGDPGPRGSLVGVGLSYALRSGGQR